MLGGKLVYEMAVGVHIPGAGTVERNTAGQ